MLILLETVSFIQKTAAIHAKNALSRFIILKITIQRVTEIAVFIFLSPILGGLGVFIILTPFKNLYDYSMNKLKLKNYNSYKYISIEYNKNKAYNGINLIKIFI